MNKKAFVIVVILASLMAFGLVSIAFAANGPKTSKMEIHIYDNPDTENAALQTGVLDINDWPLTKTWIDAWALMPAQVKLDSYVELGMMEIDINNQAWPTGDPANKFYKLSAIQSNQSLAFRQAVAYLTDRDSIITQVLKGYGYKMTVPLPPFQSQYMDMINYTNSAVTYNVGSNSYELNASVGGITYPYSPAMAAYILDKAGFVWNTGHTSRIDPSTGQDMKAVKFYIRQDDPNRLQAGQMLAAALKNIGVPVNSIVTEKTVCYKSVMVLYDYNLYTGGWSLSVIPNEYHDLFASETYYYPLGWSVNYPGFCNNGTLFGPGHSDSEGFDYWALKVAYPATIADAEVANKVAGFLFLKYCAIVPMYCSNAVKAYKTGDTGVINNAGGGVDNYYTFLNGVVADNQWDYGFKSNIEQLNQISSQWLWDQNCLGLMYESLMGVNPFNLAETEYWIAQSSSAGSWDATAKGGDVDATYINFTIRPNVYWHNNMTAGRNLDVYDINFSFYFTKACGAAVAWNYPSVKAFDHITIDTATNTTGIYYLYKSAWALLQAGGLPILNRDTWGALWNTANPTWQTDVRNYDPVTADANGNGLKDIYEDGTGAWIFGSYVANEYVTLNANPYYYLSQDYIAGRLSAMFHDGAGDVNGDGTVSTQDLGLMARALFTTPASPHGTDWGQWNPACDLDGNGVINSVDLSAVARNYGATAG